VRPRIVTILRVQADGTCFAGGARWRDRWVMRLSVISAPTTEADIDRSCEAICKAWWSVARSNLTALPERGMTFPRQWTHDLLMRRYPLSRALPDVAAHCVSL
jgi:hypothetical protein